MGRNKCARPYLLNMLKEEQQSSWYEESKGNRLE